MLIRDVSSAKLLISTYRIVNNTFILGSLSSGVTVYKQQVRAHNLALALAVLAESNEISLRRIAVIGGGIAGLTVTAGLMSLLPQLEVTVLEKRWDLCPIQQGAETRWLHPHIYDWPEEGSRAPSADLPLLSWREGTAAEVVSEILQRFAEVCVSQPKGGSGPICQRLNLYIGVNHLSINPMTQEVEWVGRKAELDDSFVIVANGYGATERFDAVIVASGFGVESGTSSARTPSYWRNDSISQPLLVGERQSFIVSGHGDGAIVDLCRLTIERFRQGSILRELLKSDVDRLGNKIAADPLRFGSFKDFVQKSSSMEELVTLMVQRIQVRLRKDLMVVLHGAGKNGKNKSIWDLLAGKSSFMNKVLLYSLFKAGAFTLTFDSLKDVVRLYNVTRTNQIIRHGTRAKGEVLRLFVSPDLVSSRLNDMESSDEQSADQLWPAGSFPPIPRSR